MALAEIDSLMGFFSTGVVFSISQAQKSHSMSGFVLNPGADNETRLPSDWLKAITTARITLNNNLHTEIDCSGHHCHCNHSQEAFAFQHVPGQPPYSQFKSP